MTVYFQGAELQDFPAPVGVAGMVTTAGSFDPAVARCSVYIASNATENVNYLPVIMSAPATDAWFHFEATFGSAGNNRFWRLFSGTTPLLGTYFTADGALVIQKHNGTAWVTLFTTPDGTVTANSPSSDRKTFDIRVKIGNPGEFRLYVGKVPVFAENMLDLTWAGVTSFDRLRLASSFTTLGDGATRRVHFSQVLIADWITLGSRVVTRAANANGSLFEWAGVGHTALNEITPAATNLTSGAADQRISVGMAPFPALGVGERIEGVKVAINALRDAAGPQKANIFFKVAGTVDDKSDRGLTVTAADYSEVWDMSPNTGTYWTPNELNASEPGVRSRA